LWAERLFHPHFQLSNTKFNFLGSLGRWARRPGSGCSLPEGLSGTERGAARCCTALRDAGHHLAGTPAGSEAPKLIRSIKAADFIFA